MRPVVELGQHVAFPHVGIVVDRSTGVIAVGPEALDHSHDLSADVDNLHRLNVPGGGDADLDVVARDRQRAELRRFGGEAESADRRTRPPPGPRPM